MSVNRICVGRLLVVSALLYLAGVSFIISSFFSEKPASGDDTRSLLKHWKQCDKKGLSFAVGETLQQLARTSGTDAIKSERQLQLGVFPSDWPALLQQLTNPECDQFSMLALSFFQANDENKILSSFSTHASISWWHSSNSGVDSEPHFDDKHACSSFARACKAFLTHTSVDANISIYAIHKSAGYFWFGEPLAHDAEIHVLEPFYVSQHPSQLMLAAPTAPRAAIDAWRNSALRPCDHARAERFFKEFGGAKEEVFHIQARQLLARATNALHETRTPFWIGSGTLLGWYRQCGFIGHAKDVDVGVFAADFDESMIAAMAKHGLQLSHRFGHPADTFELSFKGDDGLKVDVFFFYREDHVTWNGGTQARTGKKFKYSFKPFDLCWTNFDGVVVRVPCDTLSYIRANYGDDWLTPVEVWDWKRSPPNVRENGMWPADTWPEYIRCDNCMYDLSGNRQM